MKGFLPGDPTLGLAIATFRDELGTGQLGRDGYPRRGRSGEQQAAAFWLELRGGPRGRSLSDLEPRIGRSLSTIDVAGSVEAIGRCLDVVPSSWRAVTVVAAGWRIGVAQLRASEPPDGGPPWLERAGLSATLPQGLSRHALNVRVRAFREELIRRRIVVGPAWAEEGEEVEPTFAAPRVQLIGWKSIAGHLGVAERTAQRWVDQGLPVQQRQRGALVWAVAEELDAWRRETGALEAG